MKKNMHGVLMCLAGLLMTAIFGFLQFGHPSAITAPVDEAGNSMSGSSALILMVVGLLIFAGGIMLAPAALSSVLSGALPGTAGKLILHLLNATIPAALVTLGIAVALLAGGIVLRVLLPKRKALA